MSNQRHIQIELDSVIRAISRIDGNNLKRIVVSAFIRQLERIVPLFDPRDFEQACGLPVPMSDEEMNRERRLDIPPAARPTYRFTETGRMVPLLDPNAQRLEGTQWTELPPMYEPGDVVRQEGEVVGVAMDMESNPLIVNHISWSPPTYPTLQEDMQRMIREMGGSRTPTLDEEAGSL